MIWDGTIYSMMSSSSSHYSMSSTFHASEMMCICVASTTGLTQEIYVQSDLIPTEFLTMSLSRLLAHNALIVGGSNRHAVSTPVRKGYIGCSRFGCVLSPWKVKGNIFGPWSHSVKTFVCSRQMWGNETTLKCLTRCIPNNSYRLYDGFSGINNFKI